MRRVISASRRVRKTGAVPVLGLTRAKSAGARVKPRSGSSIVRVSWRKKAHLVCSKRRSSPPNTRAQNLKTRDVHVREEGGICSEPAVLEVEQAGDASAGGDGLEEVGGGLVGVDAGGREQSDEAIRLDQGHRPLDEQRVEVDVTAAEKGIVAGGAN